MDILISNLLSESIFHFGKWSNGKYTNTHICVFSVSQGDLAKNLWLLVRVSDVGLNTWVSIRYGDLASNHQVLVRMNDFALNTQVSVRESDLGNYEWPCPEYWSIDIAPNPQVLVRMSDLALNTQVLVQ